MSIDASSTAEQATGWFALEVDDVAQRLGVDPAAVLAAYRVGDSPIIGAGTYADNATCAVSASRSSTCTNASAGSSGVASRRYSV